MKQILTITRTFPNGKRRIARIYSLKDGVSVNCTVEYTNPPTKSAFESRRFNHTKTFDTLAKNVERARKWVGVGDNDKVIGYNGIYVTYTSNGRRYACEVEDVRDAMRLAEEMAYTNGITNVHVNKCGKLGKDVIIVKYGRKMR